MSRLCERPGCSEAGAVGYGMNAPDLVSWVEPLRSGAVHDARVLCRRHADAMVVPRGWTLDDRREPVPRLFRPPPPAPSEPEASPPADRPAPRRRRAEPVATEPLPLEAPRAAPDVDPVPEPGSDVGAERWAPAFDTDDDLDGLLAVESPLLARAFGGGARHDRDGARGEGRARR